MKINSPLASLMLEALRTALTDGFILVYKGAVPVDADAPGDANNLLGVFTTPDGTSITLGAAVGNTVEKDAATPKFVCNNPVAAGTATHFRYIPNYDGGQATSVANGGPGRVQGTVGKSGADLLMPDPVFVLGTPKDIDFFSITLPYGT
jgi:hypothetical protein